MLWRLLKIKTYTKVQIRVFFVAVVVSDETLFDKTVPHKQTTNRQEESFYKERKK